MLNIQTINCLVCSEQYHTNQISIRAHYLVEHCGLTALQHNIITGIQTSTADVAQMMLFWVFTICRIVLILRTWRNMLLPSSRWISYVQWLGRRKWVTLSPPLSCAEENHGNYYRHDNLYRIIEIYIFPLPANSYFCCWCLLWNT